MVEAVEPQLLNGGEYEFESTDQAALRLTIEPDNELWKFLKLPVGLPAPLTVDANVDGASGTASVSVDAPYLSQGNKLIERTRIAFNLDARAGTSDLKLATNFPGKGGRANLSLSNRSERGVNTTDLGWVSETGVNHGALSLATTFSRDEENRLATDINLLPGGNIIFADTLWQVSPARIAVTPGRLQVDNFKVARDNQWLTISGASTADSTEQLVVELRNINLDYVFETLNISDNVMFGGQATGTLYASQLFSKTPKAFTDNLHVENLAYNHCVMGNGDIRSAFHPDDGSITIDADIETPFTGGRSQINGRITPVGEKLDFRFHADKAPVGFLQPFMAAFCDKITGTVSGDAHLFGTFKLLDMEGRVVGHDLAMDLGFTGTTYHASDTVVINPGRIELPNITLTDDYGHTAVLSGWLTHNSFHDPAFNFNISDAHNFLCYSVKENPEHPWYGKVFGNGNASIDGKPGLVAINVNMATAPGTDFSFVLSDAEVAAEYDFLTFRDGRPVSEQVIVQEVDTVPPLVKAIRAATARKSSESSPTNYTMSFNIDVTPQAKMTLVMDPVGGDKIRAVGSGNMLMTYDAASEEMKMYGTYTVERGDYNFSLQDIIIKEFKIDPGSSIAFHGNPYTAQLDLRAYYALTANLTDLDESFGQDRDLARTTVPVRAMLYVTGDMRSPELSFDLNFPTLSQDTYRKVKSLVSTDEMMNQQIIYLLALNRFYTPEYVAATRGSELASVASSTLSSRLSSILGTLSDKINVAPTFRTDRGDFSDMEVDVALSSSLLNNRLLLNGTLGYRDNTLNSNQFIGDFDVEYLLNRQGSIRLKAYNRYNDRNLYLKTALTTQGVGVVFKRDFDNIFSFLKPIRNWFRRKKSEEKKSD